VRDSKKRCGHRCFKKKPVHEDGKKLDLKNQLLFLATNVGNKSTEGCARYRKFKTEGMDVYSYKVKGTKIKKEGGKGGGQGMKQKLGRVAKRTESALVIVHAEPCERENRGLWQGRP